MKRILNDLLLSALWQPMMRRLCWGRKIPEGFDEWKNIVYSWSQFGEDLVIYGILNRAGLLSTPMVYVDVGAFHPVQYSNTLLLRKLGWRGINIDPNPDTISLFSKVRPDDLNLQCGIGLEHEVVSYVNPKGSGVCATGKLSARERQAESDRNNPNEVSMRRLDEVLSSYPWSGRQLGLLNVDTEGVGARRPAFE